MIINSTKQVELMDVIQCPICGIWHVESETCEHEVKKEEESK